MFCVFVPHLNSGGKLFTHTLVNVQASVTAITFVALGTSLPDTFASKSAAIGDDNARPAAILRPGRAARTLKATGYS